MDKYKKHEQEPQKELLKELFTNDKRINVDSVLLEILFE